jgi:phosphatidylglycerophosphate synthase
VLDATLRRLIEKPLARLAAPLARAGIAADWVTWAGFALGLGAAVVIALGQPLLGLGLFLANRLADGLDGAIARQRGPSDYGGYLDIVLDFLVYNALAAAFGLADPAARPAALVLMLSFAGSGTSFLAYAILAAKRGRETAARGRKSFYHLGGLAEGGETVAFFVVSCLMPQHFAPLAWVFAGLCLLTTAGRVLAARRDFGGASP